MWVILFIKLNMRTIRNFVNAIENYSQVTLTNRTKTLQLPPRRDLKNKGTHEKLAAI